MGCHYCGYHNGGHHPYCPKPDSLEMNRWHQGYKDGRNDRLCMAADPPYTLGYDMDKRALEEAQNGHDPHFA